MILQRKITQPYNYPIEISKSGLVAISISARCRSRRQLGSRRDEDLRIKIDGLNFREIPPKKKVQLFNIPASWNGSKLKGLKKTVIFLIVLNKGKHIISLIPRNSAFVEEIEVEELIDTQDLEFDIEEQAEDGDRRPWRIFVLVNLPLREIRAEATIQYRWWDSDDVKIIIDNKIQRQSKAKLHRFWFFAGILIKKLYKKLLRKKKTFEYTFETNLLPSAHYIEFWADKTPILHKVELELDKIETPVFRKKAKVVERFANLRQEPNTSSLVLAELKRGRKLEVLQKIIQGEAPYKERGDYTNIWHKVKVDGKKGFVFSKTIEIEGENNEIVKELIKKVADELDIDSNLMVRLAREESQFFPYAVSKKKAKGIFQLTPIAIRQIRRGRGEYGYLLEDPFDIKQNIQGGIRYFKWLYEVYHKNEPQRLEKVLIGWNWRLDHTPKGERINWQRIPSGIQEFIKRVLEKLQREIEVEGVSKMKLIFGVGGILVATLLGFTLKEIFYKGTSVIQVKEEFKRENLEQTKVELFSDLDGDGQVETLFFEEIQPEESIIVLRKVNVYLREGDENKRLLKDLDGVLDEVRIIDLNQDGQKEIIVDLMPSNRVLTQVYTFENNQLVLVPIIPEDPAQGFFNRHGIELIDLEKDGIKEIYVPRRWFYTDKCEGQGEIYKYYNGQFIKFLEAKETSEWCREFKG